MNETRHFQIDMPDGESRALCRADWYFLTLTKEEVNCPACKKAIKLGAGIL